MKTLNKLPFIYYNQSTHEYVVFFGLISYAQQNTSWMWDDSLPEADTCFQASLDAITSSGDRAVFKTEQEALVWAYGRMLEEIQDEQATSLCD